MSTEKKRNVNVLTMDTPKSLTLTKHPANQIGFRVVRSDTGEETIARRVRRARSDQKTSFLYIEFPAGTAPEDAAKEAEAFGVKGYEVIAEDDRVIVRRSDYVLSDAPTVSVNIGGGRKVVMLRSDINADPAPDSGLQLIALSFDKSVYRSDDEVSQYLQDKGIDTSAGAVENTDTHYIFRRSDVKAEGTAGKIEVDSGVTVSVVRADIMDVPEPLLVVVNEAAYGSWGWGQLDFSAAMADVEFSRMSDEAIYRLRDVLENILFYNRLPVAARKELIARATSQFSSFIGSLLDGLPEGVVLASRSDNQKESQMSTKKTEGEAQTITRADVETIVAESLSKALPEAPTKALEGANITRSEPTPEPTPEDPVLKSLENITRSLGELSTSVTAVSDRVGKIESTTVVRSDSPDDEDDDDDDAEGDDNEATNKTRNKTAKRTDVFAGIFSRNLRA